MLKGFCYKALVGKPGHKYSVSSLQYSRFATIALRPQTSLIWSELIRSNEWIDKLIFFVTLNRLGFVV